MTDTEFTRLVEPDLDEVHAVKGAANGTPFLVAKQAEAAQGLLAPELVRELVAKAEPAAPEPVTFSGSPAAVADLMHRMHGAPVRKAEMSSKEINDLPDSAFAYIEPGGEKDDEGKTTPRSKRHFPVHDAAHTRDALSRAPQSPFGDKAMPKIRAAAKKFDIEVAKADATADPGSPTWESADAASGEKVTGQILACIPAVRALVMREATEVGAGHTDDICDVFELQSAIDALTCAAKSVAAFAASEHAEAGETGVSKAQQAAAPNTAATAATSPKENTVDTTTTEVTKAEGDAAAAGTEQAQPVSKAAALAAQLGISTEKLAEIGAQAVLKAAADAAGEAADTKTTGATEASNEARTIPGTNTVQAPVVASDDVSKAEATQQLATAFGEAVAPVVKQLGELTTQVGAQLERVEKFAAKADDNRSPFLNGAAGTAGPAQRGAGDSPEMQTILKAIDAIPAGPARDEAKRAVALQALAARFGG